MAQSRRRRRKALRRRRKALLELKRAVDGVDGMEALMDRPASGKGFIKVKADFREYGKRLAPRLTPDSGFANTDPVGEVMAEHGMAVIKMFVPNKTNPKMTLWLGYPESLEDED